MIIMNYAKMLPITTSSLLDSLCEPTDCVLLDCRSFITYNGGHIKSAINVCCPSLLRRRLKRENATLDTLISCPKTLGFLRNAEAKCIVLYDEKSASLSDEDFDTESSSRTIAVVGRFIANDLKEKVYYLIGGFQAFKEKHPNMCECPQQEQQTRGLASLQLDFGKGNRAERKMSEEIGEKTAPVEILPFLYLGNASHCACKDTLNELGVTAVMNVSKTINNHFQDHFLYKNVPVDDTYNADISRWFRIAVDFIDSVEMSGGKVLIHCQAGISRSATICLAYLMSKRKCSLEEAYEYVKERRPVISPNFNFMGQLLTWEREIKSKMVATSDPLSPSQSPCGLFNYSAMNATTDTGLHANNCYVSVTTPT